MSASLPTLTDALKERVHEKVVKSGAMDRIDHRIKQGMCAAIESLRGDKTPKPIFADLGFKKGRIEIVALQSIYQFLASVGLNWTLETLSQDTNVKPQPSAVPLVDWLTNPPKGAIDLEDENNGEEAEADEGEGIDVEEEDGAEEPVVEEEEDNGDA
jgi:hypothetical protein